MLTGLLGTSSSILGGIVLGMSYLDTDAPIFDGVQFVAPYGVDGVIALWQAAEDDGSLKENITYNIYAATDPGEQNFALPTASVTGETMHALSGLTPGFTYYIVVRAEDEAGNEDTNTTELSATTGSDIVAPTIGNFSPTAGTAISRTAAIAFDVTDNLSAFRRIIVTVEFVGTTGVDEVVHDGDGFKGYYGAASNRSAISGGYRYTVSRSGGWPGAPTFRVYAIDTAGNEAD